MLNNPLSMARDYVDKYGCDMIEKLEQDAIFCETEDNLPQRNRLRRVRDQILLEDQSMLAQKDKKNQ